ncbi:MAG TPA: excinuclease ABC subunit UvrC [Firmicutes bacterium]|nr:excinuclease ABC subunit UvrC [Bacillota bacterium]
MDLEKKLELLPERPGVYLMKDRRGEIIYVGKAVNLKSRVRSYFKSHDHAPKVRAMLEHVADFEYIVTDSEVEALALECNFIKKEHPRYNILLRDDKQYPYLKLTVNEEFPRLLITRRLKEDGARYFGPYTDVGALNDTVRLLKKVFPLRTCSPHDFAHRDRPCLNFHIKRCLGPCTGRADRAAYQEMVKELTLFLEGRQEVLVKRLKGRMEAAAAGLRFEEAAELRDQVAALERVLEKQKVVSLDGENQDVVALARGVTEACVQVFQVRHGKLAARETFFLKGTEGHERPAVLAGFLKDYYSRAAALPPTILLAEPAEDQELLAQYLSRLADRRVSIRVPQRGAKKELAALAANNATLALREEEELWAHREARTEGAVAALKAALGLERLPRRIEGFDISNIQGQEAVAAMVVFEDGRPRKGHYRRFRIRTVLQANDFAMMAEAVRRRYSGNLRDKLPLPDLILIDGGKGQLGAARAVLRELGLAGIPTYGLAKQHEELYAEGSVEPLRLPRDSVALQLLQQVRDEAHRFGITYHRSLHGREALRSELEEVPGIGPRRRKALLKHFGSLKRLREATLEELLAVPGLTRPAAEALYAHLHE